MVISGYRISERLETCSQGFTARAVRESDGIKVILRTLDRRSESAATVDRMKRGFQIGSSLEFSGIMRPLDWLESGSLAVEVLEDKGGLPLETLLAQGRVDLVLALKITRSLAESLSAIHDSGYIHQHIQPCNIWAAPSTGEAFLTGFEHSSSVPRTMQGLNATAVVGVDLAYISPEQTGRTNRFVDYRTDFYSLGVVLYRVLTGQLPFQGADPMELVYAHIARTPVPPYALNISISETLSSITLRLMEKTAENRYQGGHGLREDLDKCIKQLEEKGVIEHFELGAHDRPTHFELPQKIYGRDSQSKVLLDAFERARKGEPNFILVEGQAGVGKTALVNKMIKTVALLGDYFIAGKFDNLKREMPYGVTASVTGQLVSRILADPPEKVEALRQKLKKSLGRNLGVLAEGNPYWQKVLGEVAPPAPLGPVETKNRFHMCVHKMFKVIASQEHSIVLFLDDLQWADPFTLELLEVFVEKQIGKLLLIGTLRNDEAETNHPLLDTVQAIGEKGVRVETISLEPLGVNDVLQLCSDTLHAAPEKTLPLADLVHRKTAGNPYHVRTFLSSLYEEGLINFDNELGWSWDLERSANLEDAENVIDLTSRSLAHLEEKTRHVISIASALGNQFDAETLAAICKLSVKKTERHLLKACRERVLVPQNNRYHFAHDRIQEAAYALIPQEKKSLTHLQIGRILSERILSDQTPSTVFEVVSHLERASMLLSEPKEIALAAQLHFSAGNKAKAEAAFKAAYKYYVNGAQLLGDKAWEENYDLALALWTSGAEAAYLSGGYRDAKRRIDVVLKKAHGVLDAIPAYEVKIALAHSQLREDDALAISLEVLALLGFDFDRATTAEKSLIAVTGAKELITKITSRNPEDLQAMQNPTMLAASRILMRSALVAGWMKYDLYQLMICTLVDITFKYGRCPESPVIFAAAGGVIGYVLEDYETSYKTGAFGLKLIDRPESARWRSLCLFYYHITCNCWKATFRVLSNGFKEAFHLGLESGDMQSLGSSAFCHCVVSLYAGINLPEISATIADYTRDENSVALERANVGIKRLGTLIKEFTGAEVEDKRTHEITSLQEKTGKVWYKSSDRTIQQISFAEKMLASLVFKRLDVALESALKADALPVGGATGVIPDDFFICLSILRNYHQIPKSKHKSMMEIVERRLGKLHRLAQACPENYLHKAHLVEAEHMRILERPAEATNLYEKALQGASEQKFLHEEALTAEFAADYHRNIGNTTIANSYMDLAIQVYSRWGAKRKVKMLYAEYAPINMLQTTKTETGQLHELKSFNEQHPHTFDLDLDSIEKAAMALASDLDLKRLTSSLISILLHNTGAQRGYLFEMSDGEINVLKYGHIEERGVVLEDKQEADESALFMGVIHYVSRTLETVILEDASEESRFAADPYVAAFQPKSILCCPLLHQGEPVAFLYFENNSIRAAFSKERLTAVQVISAQVAVGLENAKLHSGLLSEIEARRNTEQDLRTTLEELDKLKNRLEAENQYLQQEIQGQHDFAEIVGQAPLLLKTLHKVEQVAATKATVLITGETGTGKELVARALHNRSNRKEHPLVKINCAALPENLIESELFGHEKGAFTGALEKKVGRFELADSGTIFLDEIGEIPLQLQAKLLRVLQEGEFERIGATKTTKVDVRIVAATNRDLEQDTAIGKFRPDLFYRLSVFPIEVPPLRDRRNDIPLLVEYFVDKKSRNLGRLIEVVPAKTMDALISYDWPGNVRELENVIERAIILSSGSTLILDESFTRARGPRQEEAPEMSLQDNERAHIILVLEECNWKVRGPGNAADRLGLNESTLRSRMKKLGIKRPRL